MSHYGYLRMCPECKGIAEFSGKTYSNDKAEMVYNCCKCIPQKLEDELIEATEDAELTHWKELNGVLFSKKI